MSTNKRIDIKSGDCSCKDEADKGTTEIKKEIAKMAAVLSASLPDRTTCNKMADPRKAYLLSTLRDFAAECTLANSWSDTEARSYGKTLDIFVAVSQYFILAKDNDTTPTEGENCSAALDRCNKNCHADTDAGYWCFVQCRMEYVVCLGDILLPD
jgi:hypothetical protein